LLGLEGEILRGMPGRSPFIKWIPVETPETTVRGVQPIAWVPRRTARQRKEMPGGL
jgi:hypothetical protein